LYDILLTNWRGELSTDVISENMI